MILERGDNVWGDIVLEPSEDLGKLSQMRHQTILSSCIRIEMNRMKIRKQIDID